MAFFLYLFLIQTTLSDTIPFACSTNYNKFDFCDTSKTIDFRVNSLINELTLDEKIPLLTARQSPYNNVLRLGIPEYDWGANCIHGAQTRCGTSCPTLFPEPNALGASWNRSLIRNMSVVIGLELRALWRQGMGEYHDSNLPHTGLNCWSPTVNIGRDPRWGRMYEIPSEDPMWNGIYGSEYTFGLQNGSSKYHDNKYYLVIVTLKHFDAYSLEDIPGTSTTRHNFNAIVSDYMLSDTYWPAFKRSIQSGGAKGVMCSYNSVNGIPSCANDFLLNQTMRQSWGFSGYITSDSGAIRDVYDEHHYTKTLADAAKVSLEASCDLDSCLGTSCGGISTDFATNSPYSNNAKELVNNGDMDESFIDKSLYNTFKLRFQLGLFDQPITEQTYYKIPNSIINSAEHQQLNIEASRQVMTLLKNENVLPLNVNDYKTKKIAFIGPHYNASADLIIKGAYTGQICPDDTTNCVPSLLTELSKHVSTDNILYSEGCDVSCSSSNGFNDAISTANKADTIVLAMGLDLSQERESHDRTNITLPGLQSDLALQICKLNKPTILLLLNGGVVAIDNLVNVCPSILEAWYPGFRGAQAVIETLFGINNPSGKLAVTMYQSNYVDTKYSNYSVMNLDEQYGKTYRYWRGPKPLYSFGYGLSYTQYEYQDGNCNAPQYCIDITNIGNMDGSETIFVFMIPPGNTTIPSSEPASKLLKQMIDFDKFNIKQRETVRFKYNFNENNAFMLYNSKGEPTLFKGEYKLVFSDGNTQNIEFSYNVTQTKILPQKIYTPLHH